VPPLEQVNASPPPLLGRAPFASDLGLDAGGAPGVLGRELAQKCGGGGTTLQADRRRSKGKGEGGSWCWCTF